jgi:hypothetical protein
MTGRKNSRRSVRRSAAVATKHRCCDDRLNPPHVHSNRQRLTTQMNSGHTAEGRAQRRGNEMALTGFVRETTSSVSGSAIVEREASHPQEEESHASECGGTEGRQR